MTKALVSVLANPISSRVFTEQRRMKILYSAMKSIRRVMIPCESQGSLPDTLKPEKLGKERAADLWGSLATGRTGMVPIEARMADMLNAILNLSPPFRLGDTAKCRHDVLPSCG
jgi:hypothetical protein